MLGFTIIERVIVLIILGIVFSGLFYTEMGLRENDLISLLGGIALVGITVGTCSLLMWSCDVQGKR